MSDIFNNSIWPNGLQDAPEGHPVFYPLGTNKVEIPDGITTMWPDGDKLIGDFVYKNGKVVGFIDTKALIPSSSGSTTMNYSYIDINLPSIYEGELTVNAPNATVKKITWAVVAGEDKGDGIVTLKYKGCKTVSDVNAVDPNYETTDIVDGVWSEGLGDLENGFTMFSDCYSLITFTSDLSSLTNGMGMFMSCENLTTFTSDLSSLTDGNNMFYGCSKLTTFTSDSSGSPVNLSSLTNGSDMFRGCSKLTTFTSDLISLTNGYGMFYYCKLNASSVKNIIDTINTYSGDLTLGMGCNNTTEDKDLFAQEAGYNSMTELLAALTDKGWSVTTQFTGRPTTTYGLRRPSEDTLPVFVKLEEDEKYGNYTSDDESKKYRLDYFHETTGSTEGYTQFNSLEEAIETLNIKPIERN